MARAGAVHLVERVEAVGGDGLPSPVQARVLSVLRRSVAIALALGAEFAARTGLDALKRANLEGTLGADKRVAFGELLQAEALAVLHVFGNAVAFLLAPHASEVTVEFGGVEEVLTDNASGLAGCALGVGSGYRRAGLG